MALTTAYPWPTQWRTPPRHLTSPQPGALVHSPSLSFPITRRGGGGGMLPLSCCGAGVIFARSPSYASVCGSSPPSPHLARLAIEGDASPSCPRGTSCWLTSPPPLSPSYSVGAGVVCCYWPAVGRGLPAPLHPPLPPCGAPRPPPPSSPLRHSGRRLSLSRLPL